ncbi:MAG: hypothetical protein D6798_01920 [Deltaproteobacteria bacterium]|nr:MAG: hypothetical protein D6798_01920 [Deltaproteobacteria bacterium]
MAGVSDPARIERLHAAACRRRDTGYVDPDSGLLVLTAWYLRSRGYCCGTGCRHCPYPPDEQAAAGRKPASSE